MRGAVLLVLAACGHAAPAPVAPPAAAVPKLKAPPAADPAARGAAYLSQVALQLQPGWGQFLDDCRLRLPVDHALNQMRLAATADIAIYGDGKVARVDVTNSGNRDFDRAVRDAIADAAPLPAPPSDLVSDDDLVHLRWLFARDRRQAGPANAQVVDVELPLLDDFMHWKDHGRLARRIIRASDSDRAKRLVIPMLMEIVVWDALEGDDRAALAAALDAIRRAHIKGYTHRVRQLIALDNALDVQLAAIAALAEASDRQTADALAGRMRTQLRRGQRATSRALARALSVLGEQARLEAELRFVLDDRSADPEARTLALALLAFAPNQVANYSTGLDGSDAPSRAATCAAMTAVDPATATPRLARGLRDGDASVRAACVDAARAQLEHHADDRRVLSLLQRVRELARDRDVEVRRRAVAAVVALDPAHAIHAVDDAAPEVRAAYAGALQGHLDHPDLAADANELLEDRAPEVRAAAWRTLAAGLAHLYDAAAPARAAADPSPEVRAVVAAVLTDDQLLARLAASDDSPAVRTEALVRLTARRGRAASEVALLEQIAAAGHGSPERVRAALAWLLAK